MENQTKPQMSIQDTGKEYKILKVTGAKDAQMPLHFSTKEAIIVVLKGKIILKLGDKDIHLSQDESAIIPASEPHTLSVKEDFTANVIMGVESEIKFINN